MQIKSTILGLIFFSAIFSISLNSTAASIILLPKGNFDTIKETEEIIGCWKSINLDDFITSKINITKRFDTAEFYWMCFDEKGNMRSIDSAFDISNTELLDSVDNLPIKYKYKINAKGVLTIYEEGQTKIVPWVTSLVKERYLIAENEIPQGALLMTVPRKNGGWAYYRFMSKVIVTQ